MKNKKTWQTTDLGLTTTISLFCPIKEIDKTNPKKVQFVFESSKELNLIIDNYWKGKIKVDPAKYFNQLRVIKSRIYDRCL